MYVKLNESDYARWNDFCLKHHWFWHTTYWQEYIMNSKFDTEFKNHSFFNEVSGAIRNIIPLIQEGDTLYSPGFPDERELLKEVKRIATDNNIKHIKVDSDIKSFLNTSGYTCILDLDNVKPTKGHKSAIKKGEKHLRCEVSTDILAFRKFYFKIAKKRTRPNKAFEILGDWINQRFGTLLKAYWRDTNEVAGYVYILHFGNYAYYFMSAVLKRFRQYNVTHLLQSKAFEILRDKGITHYEMGEQVYNSLHCHPSSKESTISKFKRSFGGEVIVKPSCEYFLSPDYMLDTYAERIHKYWSIEQNG